MCISKDRNSLPFYRFCYQLTFICTELGKSLDKDNEKRRSPGLMSWLQHPLNPKIFPNSFLQRLLTSGEQKPGGVTAPATSKRVPWCLSTFLQVKALFVINWDANLTLQKHKVFVALLMCIKQDLLQCEHLTFVLSFPVFLIQGGF